MTFRPDLGEDEERGRSSMVRRFDVRHHREALRGDALDLVRFEIETDDGQLRVRPGE